MFITGLWKKQTFLSLEKLGRVGGSNLAFIATSRDYIKIGSIQTAVKVVIE